MPLKILHTADVHLGMKFAGYDDIQLDLTEARYRTLEKLVDIANRNDCNLFVIAGDLYDRRKIPQKDITRTVQILNQFDGELVLVLPGNHDFVVADDNELWGRFKANSGGRILLLEKPKVYSLHHYDLDVNIYAAPCDSKLSSDNRIAWIKDYKKDENVKYHMGVAHGSLESISPDFDGSYYPMTEEGLKACRLDIWLLGHTDRLQYPQTPGTYDKIFYSGTPEPNDFNCKHEGRAWLIELDDNKTIEAKSIISGRYRFIQDEIDVREMNDIKEIERKYLSDEYMDSLLRLSIKGRLFREDLETLLKVKQKLRSGLFYVDIDDSGVSERITKENIDREFAEGSFPHRLLVELFKDDESAEALQMAYDLISKMKR